MARWASAATTASSQVDVRGQLLAKYRARVERYGSTTGPWPLLVRRLEAGEPVVVRGWQLRRFCGPRIRANGRYVVEPDGSVARIAARAAGDG